MILSSTTLVRTFAALRSPNYRLWFGGQLISLVGSWMQTTAQGYLVFELTHSTAYLGYVGFAAGLPSWLLMLLGGVVADRLPRRTVLILTQTAMMLLALLLAALVASGRVVPWHIVALALGVGIATAFDAPARQSFVVELVDREDLTNAIALNSTMFNSAVVLGPAIGAAIYAALGPAWCFALNGLSFLAVIAALARMKIVQPVAPPASESALRLIGAGLRYTMKDRIIRTLIANLGLMSLLGIGLLTLLPAWSVNILRGDVRTNGLLLSARGVGAVIGALGMAALAHRAMRGRMWTLGGLFMPLALFVFGVSRWLPLSIAAMVGVGWCFMVHANSANALVQSMVPDELRGRAMSVFTLVFFGAMPLGSLLAGQVAARIGLTSTVFLNAGLLAAVAGSVYVRCPGLRRLP